MEKWVIFAFLSLPQLSLIVVAVILITSRIVGIFYEFILQKREPLLMKRFFSALN